MKASIIGTGRKAIGRKPRVRHGREGSTCVRIQGQWFVCQWGLGSRVWGSVLLNGHPVGHVIWVTLGKMATPFSLFGRPPWQFNNFILWWMGMSLFSCSSVLENVQDKLHTQLFWQYTFFSVGQKQSKYFSVLYLKELAIIDFTKLHSLSNWKWLKFWSKLT